MMTPISENLKTLPRNHVKINVSDKPSPDLSVYSSHIFKGIHDHPTKLPCLICIMTGI